MELKNIYGIKNAKVILNIFYRTKNLKQNKSGKMTKFLTNLLLLILPHIWYCVGWLLDSDLEDKKFDLEKIVFFRIICGSCFLKK